MASTSTNRSSRRRTRLGGPPLHGGNGRAGRKRAEWETAARGSACSNGRLHSLTGVQVLACAGYVPEEIVRNEDLAALGCDADWILQRTGIRERRRAAPEEATSDMAYEASRRCLERAGVRAEDVDLILVATVTPDTSMPSTACHLQKRLGVSAPAMDVNAACAGFMYALVTGMQFVKSGSSRHALVVGADLMTRIVNPADKKTFPLFGDGAGAVLLSASDGDQGLSAYTLGADGQGADLLTIPAGGSRAPLTVERLAANRHYIEMDGRAVFKWAVRLLAETIRSVLAHARKGTDELDLLVFHQANIRIIDAVASDLNVPRGKLVVNLDRYGNTSAASIPLALEEAILEDRVQRGGDILMCGFGAGLAWGAGLLKW